MAIDLQLTPRFTPGAFVKALGEKRWRLEIPAGRKGSYRLGQLDDYTTLPRKHFRWHPPVTITLRARVSGNDLPGTWGFGFWNDPFNLSIGLGGSARRFPSLPQSAWFFFASPPNYLSFRDDLPAQGFLAAVFRSAPLPSPLLACASPLLPFMLLPAAGRLMRWALRGFVIQDTGLLQVDPTIWHTYKLDWQVNQLSLIVDGLSVLQTSVSPRGPLGLVMWIDNQYAALPPNGKFSYGFLENQSPAWMELEGIEAVSK